METKEEILKLSPLESKSYESINLDGLVAYAVSLLENKKIPLYFDFIAVALFKLFPKKFSIANFDQYPDTYRINNAIRRLAGSLRDSGRVTWLTGSVEHGFSITDTGREIAKQVGEMLKNPEWQKVSIPRTRSRGRSPSDDVREVAESDAFRKWRTDQPVNSHEFFAFLRATPYTPKHLLLEHLKHLVDSATTAEDKEVSEFLAWLEDRFNNLLY